MDRHRRRFMMHLLRRYNVNRHRRRFIMELHRRGCILFVNVYVLCGVYSCID